MHLELMKQLLDCFPADVIVILDSRMVQSLDPEVYITATGSTTLCGAVGD